MNLCFTLFKLFCLFSSITYIIIPVKNINFCFNVIIIVLLLVQIIKKYNFFLFDS